MCEINKQTTIQPVKLEDQTQGCSAAVDGVDSVRRWQSGKDVGNYSTSRGVRTRRILAQTITCDYCCFSQRALHGVHSQFNHRCGAVRWAYGMLVCGLFICSSSGIVFNSSAGLIIDHIQSAKDIDPYFKFQLYVQDPSHRKPVLIYRMGWENPESERTTWVGFEHNLLTHSPACGHWAITALYCIEFICITLFHPQKFKMSRSVNG